MSVLPVLCDYRLFLPRAELRWDVGHAVARSTDRRAASMNRRPATVRAIADSFRPIMPD